MYITEHHSEVFNRLTTTTTTMRSVFMAAFTVEQLWEFRWLRPSQTSCATSPPSLLVDCYHLSPASTYAIYYCYLASELTLISASVEGWRLSRPRHCIMVHSLCPGIHVHNIIIDEQSYNAKRIKLRQEQMVRAVIDF